MTESSNKKVRVNGKDIIFTDAHKNLLECMESHNVEVHYHCRDGFCGACRISLNKGQVCYPQGEPLAFIGEGEILSCCCVPTTDIDITAE